MTIHWQTISLFMRRVMATFGNSEIGASFYMAGGTALALQLGHRRSYDLDFLSPIEDISALRGRLAGALQPFNPILADTSLGGLVYLAGSVRVGFYGYSFPMIAPFLDVDGVRLACLADLGLMKLDSILAGGSREDFHDLFAICQGLPLRQLLDLAPQKYPQTTDFEVQVVRQLSFFERADGEEPPALLKDVSWETVKAFFRYQAVSLRR